MSRNLCNCPNCQTDNCPAALPPVRSEPLFGLRVTGHRIPLPSMFDTEAEAQNMRMCHRYYSPTCLEVVRIVVEPNVPREMRRGSDVALDAVVGHSESGAE